jgi:NAD(P)-dependent dehydrogenase (short-subunit alcohol dehydrogenase family)
VTGANSGIGKEVARQLAGESFDHVYLACRNEDKARAAHTELEVSTGRSAFTVISMDVSDPRSVRAGLDQIETPLHAVIMNAGGAGGADPTKQTSDGVTEVFASNVLGHVVLLEQLIAMNALSSTAVLVGSEAARGVPKLRLPRPTFADHSVAEFSSVIDGTYFANPETDNSVAYGQAKYLGALWMADLARRHPELKLVTVSPGNTAGTAIFRDMPMPMRTLLNRVLMPYVFPRVGLSHSVEAGARRIVDAVVRDGLASGAFYASAANTLTGPLIDQSETIPDLRTPEIQANAAEAIHRFID